MMKRQLAAVALAAALASPAAAHDGVMDKTVLARMDGMKAMGAQAKQLGQMAKGETGFDAAAAEAALQDLAAEAARVPDLFAAEVIVHGSEARPVIWQDYGDFTAKAEDLEAVATGLEGTVRAQEDLGPALAEIGGTCKACHSVYRE